MAAGTHGSSSSSSSSSSSYNHEVFLSFRGKDTRWSFTDHLYHALIRAGIQTFRDNEELKHGEEIGPGLLRSIQESRISIPVFSKNYASSKWCLKEIAEIMKCKEINDQIVLPIFYKVDPSHVRNQTGSFGEAFLAHEKEYPKETVESWRKALREAGNLKGWNSEDPEFSYETSLINSVVEKASNELNKTTLEVAKHPIGIDSHLEEMLRLLDVRSKDVQFVGIQGMGGIGKTTIAKSVFNKIFCHFEGWSFLADVRERTSHDNGLVKLQNELVSDILKGIGLRIRNVDGGISVIKKRCSHKKVLIILDDVDKDSQLDALAGGHDWFGQGSRIIITTRDEHILNVDRVDKSKIYKPKELDAIQSLQLFSYYAFGRDQPPQDFRMLSEKVVHRAGGLPLALEVMGSFLRDHRRPIEWTSVLKRLKRIPDVEVQKKLKISYDGLNAEDKEIFLDIACFFIGMDEETIGYVWEDNGFSPRLGIKVLLDRSLVKIDDGNKLWMHDLLRDMGREIVRQESPKHLGKRSRLWSHEDALDVLKKNKGTSIVEGIFLNFGCESKDRSLSIEGFEPMSELRLLQVDHANLNGNFDQFPVELKWLSWKGLPSECIPTISHLEKLAVLDMSQSMIGEDWSGWQHIQLIKTLKVLDLSSCMCLTRTPDLSSHRSLERLLLDHCTGLVACHESIGHLKKLIFLSLKCCKNLMKLPDSICKLSSVKSLILSQCDKLEKLPKGLTTMKSLTELIIDKTAVEGLPDAIGSLEELERLSAKDCKKLVKLPHSMLKLRLLNYFDMTGTGIVELPEDFGMLLNLKELKMNHCEKFKGFPKNVGDLGRLSILGANNCNLLEGAIPGDFGRLSLLKFLDLSCNKFHSLPDSFSCLSQLQVLDLHNCIYLRSLPELPSSLVSLNIKYCCSMEILPDLSNLKNLEKLLIENCPYLAEIRGIESLESLIELDVLRCYTYANTLQKGVAQGMLSSSFGFDRGETRKKVLIPDSENINGTVFYFVYQQFSSIGYERSRGDFAKSSVSLCRDYFSIIAEIWRNGGKKIKCHHEIRIKGLETGYGNLFCSLYFQGCTWFGFPLKKGDVIEVMDIYLAFFHFLPSEGFRVVMLDFVMESEAIEDNEQLEKRTMNLITSAYGKRGSGQGSKHSCEHEMQS